MGIGGNFWDLIKSTDACFRQVKLAELKGAVFLFDLRGYVYKMYQNQQFSMLVHQLLTLVILFKEMGLEMIFIFEGTMPVEKQAVANKRSAERQKNIDALDIVKRNIDNFKKQIGIPPDVPFDQLSMEEALLLTPENRNKLLDLDADYKNQLNSFKNVKDEDKRLWPIFESLGVRCIRGHSEAEGVASMLARIWSETEEKDYIVLSADGDCFPFGAPLQITKFPTKSTKGENYALYNCDIFLETSGLSRNQLIELCSLCTNDFDQEKHVANFGSKKVLNFLKDYGYWNNWYKQFLINPAAVPIRGVPKPIIPEGYNPDSSRKHFVFFSYFPKEPEYVARFPKRTMRATAVISHLSSIGCFAQKKLVEKLYEMEYGATYSVENEFKRDETCDQLYREKIPEAPSLTKQEQELWDDLLENYKSELEKLYSGLKPETVVKQKKPRKSKDQQDIDTISKRRKKKEEQIFESHLIIPSTKSKIPSFSSSVKKVTSFEMEEDDEEPIFAIDKPKIRQTQSEPDFWDFFDSKKKETTTTLDDELDDDFIEEDGSSATTLQPKKLQPPTIIFDDDFY